MTDRHDRPPGPSSDLDADRLKRRAKTLKRAALRRDPEALARLAAVFGAAERPPKLADCLHAVAREAGRTSWPALKAEAELRRADRLTLQAGLGAALYGGRLGQARRILAMAPDIADDCLPLQLALYAEEQVAAAMTRDPGLVLRLQGIAPQRGLACDALTRLATSQYYRLRPDLMPVQARIAEQLLAAGAEPNARYLAPEDGRTEVSVLYGCLCMAGNLTLAERLLTAGADPNDGECAYHACEADTLDALHLLLRHGIRFPGTNALFRMLDFDRIEGAELLLGNGADPNEEFRPLGNALHHAIRRGRDGRFLDLLLRYGVDPRVPFDGRSPYALAAVTGNRAMMAALGAHGLDVSLTPAEALVAAAVSGDRGRALALLAEDGALLSRLTAAELALPADLARRPGQLGALMLMDDIGFDPDAQGPDGATPLHAAAWQGHAEYVAFYLTRSPDLAYRNKFGATALGTAIHGSANCPTRRDGDYIESVRLLIDADAAILPDAGHLDMGSDAVSAYIEDRLDDVVEC